MQLHHPDHNNGSPESARRFEEVQDAYASDPAAAPAHARRRARARTRHRPAPTSSSAWPRSSASCSRRPASPASEPSAPPARPAASASKPKRPSDEELGYIKTDDSLGKILADARKEFVERLDEAREEPLSHRVADLLDEFGAKLKGNGDDDRESAGDTQNQARKRP